MTAFDFAGLWFGAIFIFLVGMRIGVVCERANQKQGDARLRAEIVEMGRKMIHEPHC